MFKSHRFLVPIACLAGVLSIVGVGFSARIFVDDLNPVVKNAEAGVMVTEHLHAGILRLDAEEEARREVYPNRDPYDYTIGDTKTAEEEQKYKVFSELVKEYSFRKIVFSEGNPDSTSVEDGMTFFRFYYDANLGAKTYKLEPYLEGFFLIETKNMNEAQGFDIGVAVPSIKQGNPNPEVTSSLLTIDNFIQLNPTYYNLYQTEGFDYAGEKYISFKNPAIFSWTNLGEVEVIKSGSVNNKKTKFTKFSFKLDLNQMLVYESGRKPYNRDTVKMIQQAIDDSAAADPLNFKKNWGIRFKLASVLY